MTIKTFRGLLADGTQDQIRLEHRDGKVGYRIKKFQVMGITENENYEASVKIFSIKQTAVTTTVNFSDNTLLAAALYHDYSTATIPANQTIVFDGVTFNQDIYVTYAEVTGSGPDLNYYVELETISLDDVEATAVILKNFRNTNTVA